MAKKKPNWGGIRIRPDENLARVVGQGRPCPQRHDQETLGLHQETPADWPGLINVGWGRPLKYPTQLSWQTPTFENGGPACQTISSVVIRSVGSIFPPRGKMGRNRGIATPGAAGNMRASGDG